MAEEKKPDAVAEVGHSAHLRYLVEALKAERDAAATHKARAEELRDEVIELCWADPDPATGEGGTEYALAFGGYGALLVTFDDVPALRVTSRRPRRLDKAGVEREAPGLLARHTREADSPEIRLEFP